MPYDPPSQAAWMSGPATDGYPAFLITGHAAGFQGYGMGSYSYFNQGVPIVASNAFQTANPARPVSPRSTVISGRARECPGGGGMGCECGQAWPAWPPSSLASAVAPRRQRPRPRHQQPHPLPSHPLPSHPRRHRWRDRWRQLGLCRRHTRQPRRRPPSRASSSR
jgi:hypothetical protein